MRLVIAVMVVGVGLALLPWVGNASPGATERVSVDSAGNEANSQSLSLDISADGRYVSFSSVASNLVPGDTNGSFDIFVHDRETGETTRVSVASDGVQTSSGAYVATLIHTVISGDGRYVAFNSSGSDLVPGDANQTGDVFVHDLQTGQTTLVSLDETGSQFTDESLVSDISADGRYVSFFNAASVMLRDLVGGITETVAPGGGGSVSSDGRYVAFSSDDVSLVPDDTNGKTDIFVRDRQSGTTARVSVDSAGAQANGGSIWTSISDDGRYVAFESQASNLVPGDDNGVSDVFAHDRQTGVTTLVSVDLEGKPGAGTIPAMSADGRHVAFIAFPGRSSNLVAADTNGVSDVFVRHLDTGTTVRVSVNSFGEEANGGSPGVTFAPQGISADGRYVAFASAATNLIPDDTNGDNDIFVHDREAPTPISASPLPKDLPVVGGSPPASGTSVVPLVLAAGSTVVATFWLAWWFAWRKSQTRH